MMMMNDDATMTRVGWLAAESQRPTSGWQTGHFTAAPRHLLATACQH